MSVSQERHFSLLTPFSFEDRALERQYNEWKKPSVLLKIRAVSAVTGLLFIVYALLNKIVEHSEFLTLTTTIHLYFIAPSLFVISMLTFWKKLYPFIIFLLLMAPISAAIGILLIAAKIEPSSTYLIEIYFILMWTFIVSGLPLLYATTSAVLTFLIVLTATSFLSDEILIMHYFWMLATVSFGFISAYLMEQSSRTVFLNTRQLKIELDQKKELETKIKAFNDNLKNDVEVAHQEREHVEKLLTESEELFRTLFDIAPIFIDKFDENGQCVLWNKECENVFGWSIEEINASGDPIALFHPDPKNRAIMQEAFIAKKNTEFIEMHPRSRSGEKIYSRWANVNMPNGEIIYIGIDMRAQRASEKKLMQAKTALKEVNSSLEKRVAEAVTEIQNKEKLLLQQSRLAQMGEMISMIAHQWRQPLSVIDMSAFGIQSKLDHKKYDLNNAAKREEFIDYLRKELQDIHAFTQYLTGTIDDFTNFFTPNKEKEYVELNTPIQKALTILEPSIRRESVRVIENYQSDKKVNLYTYEIMHVILNIVKNSIDNFVERGIVNPTIAIDTLETPSAFVIKVLDNGKGIDPAVLSKIFDPYFSTKSNNNGTGLGLYMSKILIETHSNGALSVANIDNGVCFTITLHKEVQ
jgi:PAS domain S-box-containing protein